METGHHGLNGQPALLHVVMEFGNGLELVPILHQVEEA